MPPASLPSAPLPPASSPTPPAARGATAGEEPRAAGTLPLGGRPTGVPRGRVHYAVLALTDIAARPSGRPVALAEIARRHDLSLRYLEQVFNRLRRAGLVRSTRGPGGGYCLARPAAQLTIADIAAAAEQDCRTSKAALAELLQAACPVCRLWGAFQAHAASYLEQVTLADVAAGRIPAGAGAAAAAAAATPAAAAPGRTAA